MANSKNELYESTLKFLVPLNLQQTYKIVVDEAVRLVNGSAASIIISKKGSMLRAYSSDPVINSISPRKYGQSYRAYKKQKTILLKRMEIEKVHPEFSNTKVTSNLLIPLINRHKTIGVLSVYKSGKDNFSKKDLELLQSFGPMASLALRKAQLYGELHRAVETRDLFLSMASHELKTPITTIYVYLQLIQRNMAKNKKFDPNWIQTLIDEMVRLTKIVDELLELSRIRSGKLVYNYAEVDIKEITKRALMNFKASHKHKVIFEDNLKEKNKILVADFDKIVEVLINVLDNAAKHSPLKNPIQISLSSNSKSVTIKIKDKGKGIDQKEINRVFDGFFKTLDNTKPGMGI